MVDINSLACRPRRIGMLESSEAPLLASARPERARVGWLVLRNKCAKGMQNVAPDTSHTTDSGFGLHKWDPERIRKYG
jgi:hypothetical protein